MQASASLMAENRRRAQGGTGTVVTLPTKRGMFGLQTESEVIWSPFLLHAFRKIYARRAISASKRVYTCSTPMWH